MTPEQITQWAREAGWPDEWVDADELAAFAALVAAHEREECARVCEEVSMRGLPDQPTDAGILQNMTDRELIEAAAKAAGIEHVTPMMIKWGQWNPLTDDGDVLRLAKSCRMVLDWSNGELHVRFWLTQQTEEDLDCRVFASSDCGGDNIAIVRAAAEIGRQVRLPQDASPA